MMKLGTVEELEYYLYENEGLHKIIGLISPEGNIESDVSNPDVFVEVASIPDYWLSDIDRGITNVSIGESDHTLVPDLETICLKCGSECNVSDELENEWLQLEVHFKMQTYDSHEEFIESRLKQDSAYMFFNQRPFCGDCLDDFESHLQEICGTEFKTKIMSEQI